MKHVLIAAGSVVLLNGCNEALRPQLSTVGGNLTPDKVAQVDVPVVIPAAPPPAPGSLWVPGSKQFFRDQRAHKVGDIVTVLVAEEANASSSAKTDATRDQDMSAGVRSLPFVKGQLETRGIDLTATGLADITSAREFAGDASTDRSDSLSASIAAVVTQVLPNGLMVIQGQREVLVNYEKQVLTLSGIVRPEDISSNNTIPSSKIAEARIAYAGKGVLDEAQTPQYGVRLVDKVIPF